MPEITKNSADLISINDLPNIDMGQVKIKEHIPDSLSVQDVMNLIHTNREAWKEMMTYYRCAMMEVETKFKVLDQEFSLSYDRNPIETIKTRLKSIDSLLEKMHRKQVPPDIRAIEEHISDMAGVRVICSFVDDIYLLAESLAGQDDVRVLERKDYIENPKPSGYRGLHLVIETPIFLHDEKRMMKVEVQFRTIAMDFWASLEHQLRYKKNLNEKVSAEVSGKLSECSQTIFDLEMEMQRIKNRIDSLRHIEINAQDPT